jgi:hypothetical protein
VITTRSARFDVIHQNACATHEGRSYLVLLGIVRTPGCDEALRRFISSVRTGELDVVQVTQISGSATAAPMLGVGVTRQFGGDQAECESLRPCHVDVKGAHDFETKRRPKGST